jgi:hypothetical protein
MDLIDLVVDWGCGVDDERTSKSAGVDQRPGCAGEDRHAGADRVVVGRAQAEKGCCGAGGGVAAVRESVAAALRIGGDRRA